MAQSSEPLFSISVTARLVGTTPRVLRIYEEAELIKPYRTGGNTRLYSRNDLIKLKVISYFHRDREVNIPGIKLLLEVISFAKGLPGTEVIDLGKLLKIAPELAARLEISK